MIKISTYVLFFFIGLENYSQPKATNNKRFKPDTTINNKIILLNKRSIVDNLGDQSGKLISDDKASRIKLRTKNSREYLILYHLNGSNANTFNKFEVGILKDSMQSFASSPFDSFYSENKIKLGIALNDLIKIKGSNFIKTNKDGLVIVKYTIDNALNNFLKKYNMPVYISEYYFKKNHLIKFVFGFPNL